MDNSTWLTTGKRGRRAVLLARLALVALVASAPALGLPPAVVEAARALARELSAL